MSSETFHPEFFIESPTEENAVGDEENVDNSTRIPSPTSVSPSSRGQTLDDEEPIPLHTRKRAVRSEQWKQNVAKRACNSGQAYITVRRKRKEARVVRPPCEQTCQRCKERLTELQRQQIFEGFWSIGDHSLQWQYILRHMRVISPKKKRNGAKNKTTSRSYFFRIGKREYPVCKTMFLNTLGICDSWVESAVQKTSACGNVAPDRRGRHDNRPRRLSKEKIKTIREHIDSFQRVPSHYTRKRSKRQYLDPSLSIREMYRMYLVWAKQAKKLPPDVIASERAYRFIFNTRYNLGFHQPKNDQCCTCNTYKAASKSEKERLKPMMVRHLLNKQQSKKLMEDDANEAESNSKLCVSSFDLQKVLPCPRSKTSVFFYRNQLSVLDFTVFDNSANIGYCYVWDETTGNRGANEIASFVYDYIRKKVEDEFTEFRFYSDSCSGQNRNRFVISMYLKAAHEFGVSIRHVYLEPGHTQMEVDSIHGRIEKSTAKKEIFSKGEWMEAIRNAKVKGQTYLVTEVKQEQIVDFKDLVKKQRWDYTADKEKIKWESVKVVEVDGTSEEVRFKYAYHGATHVTNLKQKGRNVNLKTYKLQAAYQSKIPLKQKKIRDLEYLCEKGAIPSKYHDEYSAYLGFPVGATRNAEWAPVNDVNAIAFADEHANPSEQDTEEEILPEDGQDLLMYLQEDECIIPDDPSVTLVLPKASEEEGRFLLECLEKEAEGAVPAEDLSQEE